MNFREYLQNNIVYLDGGMGTLLQKRGIVSASELCDLTHPNDILDIQKAYFDAGSNVVNTNTFGANPLKYDDNQLEEIISSAISIAKKARELSCGTQEKYISLDIGPSGRLLAPLGDLSFDDAVAMYSKIVRIGVKYGVDLVTIETMNDSYETKSALLAVKENCDLPVIVTNAYGEDAKLMTGATPESMVALLEGMGADAIGANCSLGPDKLVPVIEKMLKVASVPVVLKPNAGLPEIINGETKYNITKETFAKIISDLVDKGVRVIGGCCGTTQEYIEELVSLNKEKKPLPITSKNITVVSSYTNAIQIGDTPLLVGERVNPTGKKALKQALKDNDIEYILKEALGQQNEGAHILDVNVGLPEIDEVQMLDTAIRNIQTVSDLPLQIDTANYSAMERAMRIYNGKALINSVNGTRESQEKIFPLIKKYGGVAIALTLDENGIPNTIQGRVDIAKRILDNAKEYGIDKKDIIFDPLAMAISADNNSANVTIGTIERLTKELGAKTSLGISNISFGLPNRDIVNANFLTLAMAKGLSLAIVNPYSLEIKKAYYSYRMLQNKDNNCVDYITFAQSIENSTNIVSTSTATNLNDAIVKGLKDSAVNFTKDLLNNTAPLDVLTNYIIPALDTVGKGYEQKKIYLPGLLTSAEVAKTCCELINEKLSASATTKEYKGTFVIATVKGDIHDIGKNIVSLLMNNYGYRVIDLGKDIDSDTIVKATIDNHALLVGLSALMTTTLPAMEKTIKALRQNAPWCKIVVGGAVLNKEYANTIGADKYAKDAMETVRYAESIFDRQK